MSLVKDITDFYTLSCSVCDCSLALTVRLRLTLSAIGKCSLVDSTGKPQIVSEPKVFVHDLYSLPWAQCVAIWAMRDHMLIPFRIPSRLLFTIWRGSRMHSYA